MADTTATLPAGKTLRSDQLRAGGTAALTQLTILGVVALIGLGLSISLSQHFYALRDGSAALKSFCNVSAAFNCDAVASSKYAELFWGLPLSSFSAGWYLAIFIVSLFARNAFWRREGARALLLMNGLGVFMSLAYLAVMMGAIKVYCLQCLGIDACNVLLLGLTLMLKLEGTAEHKPELPKWQMFAGVTAVSLLVSVVGLKAFDHGSLSGEEIDGLVGSVMSSPVLSVSASDSYASIGPKSAPVTIVEFSDFQCPYCKMAASNLNSILSRFPTQVRVVFRNFPLDPTCNHAIEHSMHKVACEAARAGFCANQQGKFEPIYTEFFENQESFPAEGPGHGNAKPDEVAIQAGAEANALHACMASTDTQLAIAKDVEEGIQLGIKSTPTLFLNGHKIEGAYPVAALEKMINQILAKP